MVKLKSTSFFKKKKSKKKRKVFPEFVTPAITALVGVALVSETARAVSRV